LPDSRLLARHRYRDEHRRHAAELAYPSSFTDAEWEWIAPLFHRHNPRGRPERYPRRLLLDAIGYVVRSGCGWRMLPNDFPPWQLVYATFRRWAAAGLFETMNDRLRARWREREQRERDPTASVLDSQSVRTGEKGGSAGSMRAKRSKAASATWSPTR
jgi:transposase